MMRGTRRKPPRPPRPSDPRAQARAARTPPPIPPIPDDAAPGGAGRGPGVLLWQVAAAWQREIRDVLEPIGLTHAQFVLLVSTHWLLSHAAGTPVMQADVADHARTDAVMTSEVLRTLEQKRLLRRLPHPSDGRARHLVLTAAGQRAVASAAARVAAADAAFFAPGTPARRTLDVIVRR